MPTYHPPIEDMQFVLTKVLGFQSETLDTDTIAAILGEAAKMASELLAPLNAVGDKHGCVFKDGAVQSPPGFKDAYQQYCEGGWNAVPFDPDYGGQGLPYAVSFPVAEMWQGANVSFGLCPLLTQGSIEAIHTHGTQEQKDYYLPKLISGEWNGTMNLTEPQAGSDLGLVRCKAEKQGNESYKISGQKIFITYGEHSLTDNTIHLVLARTPDAPDDVKGISMFIVPKVLEDGSRNAANCIGLEHKLGIHASPTCTMEFDGATGYLVGAENEGLKYMFTMMNNARLSVALQGVGVAEAAYQAARNYAQERVQGKSFATGERVVIAEHADVKRMLLSMRGLVEAARALTYEAALALDGAVAGDKEAQSRVEVLTPLAKSWATDISVAVASTGIQVFGGMGYIEETGAAQFYRDARILPIYEGTNGIQAADLAFRKVLRDGGAAAQAYIKSAQAKIPKDYKPAFFEYLALLEQATARIIDLGGKKDMDAIAGMAAPYLQGFAMIAGGMLMARAAGAAKAEDTDFAKDKIATAEFYLAHTLPHAEACLKSALAS